MDFIYQMLFLFLVMHQCTLNVLASGETNVMAKVLVNKTDILAKESYTTITSCYLKCSLRADCKTVGFESNPMVTKTMNCYLLKRIGSYGNDKVNGLVFMFVMVSEEDIDIIKPKLPPVHGGWTAWSNVDTCSTSCNGMLKQSRTCSSPRPQNGGCECQGEANRTFYNLALGKPSTQPSTYGYGAEENSAKMANDGKNTTRSVTGSQKNPHWKVNLKRPTKIQLIRLHLHKYAFKTNHYSLLAVHTRLTSSDDWSLCKMIGTPASIMVEIKCDTETIAQYLQVGVTSQRQILYLTEVEIFG